MLPILKQIIMLTPKEKSKSYISTLSGLTAIQNLTTDIVALTTYTESKTITGQVATISVTTLVE